MRKCEQTLIRNVRAAMRGEKYQVNGPGNMIVHRVVNHLVPSKAVEVYVRLHDNLIAQFVIINGEITSGSATFAGYQTVTTKSRINALAREFGFPGAGARFHRGKILAGTAEGGEVEQLPHHWFSIV